MSRLTLYDFQSSSVNFRDHLDTLITTEEGIYKKENFLSRNQVQHCKILFYGRLSHSRYGFYIYGNRIRFLVLGKSINNKLRPKKFHENSAIFSSIQISLKNYKFKEKEDASGFYLC